MRAKAISKTTAPRIYNRLSYTWQLVWDVCLATGWRISDVLSLPVEALKNGALALTEAKTGKKSVRPIPEQLVYRLKAHQGQFWLFPSPWWGGVWPLGRSAAYKAIKKAAKAVGAKRATPHSLRKMYAKRLKADGLEVEEIQEALQHSKLETTLLYLL